MPKNEKLAREKTIETQCMQLMRLMGFYCQKTHSGAIMLSNFGGGMRRMNLCDQGTPDIMACIYGRFVGIEIKDSPGEVDVWEKQYQSFLDSEDAQGKRTLKPSWERSVFQHAQHDLIRSAGGEVIVCSSMEELKEDIEILATEHHNKNKVL